jgi:hypothetical protein
MHAGGAKPGTHLNPPRGRSPGRSHLASRSMPRFRRFAPPSGPFAPPRFLRAPAPASFALTGTPGTVAIAPIPA